MTIWAAWLVTLSALALTVRPSVQLAPGTVAIKVRREPAPGQHWLTVAIVDRLSVIRASSIELTHEPDRKTWDYLWDGLPPCECEVVAIIEPTGEQARATLIIR